MSFDERKFGVLFRVNHGVSIKLAGSINVVAMYSVSSRKVWVFAVKLAGEGDTLKLMKTAVIDCDSPVFSISVSIGFLILGEENGVRVFPLRPLVKGRIKKDRRRESSKKSDKPEVQKINLPNGLTPGTNGSSILYVNSAKVTGNSSKTINVNGNIEEKIGKHSDNSARLKCVKLRQISKEGGVRFVTFKSKEIENYNASKVRLASIKAISVHFLGHDKFLILDSGGELYLLLLSNPVSGSGSESESICEMKKLTLTMKVQNLAVLPDDSTRAQTVWVSDGNYTIHAMVVSDMDSPLNENDTKNEEHIQNSATEAIFTSEKIQEIIPLATNAILLLGQANNIFAYAIS